MWRLSHQTHLTVSDNMFSKVICVVLVAVSASVMACDYPVQDSCYGSYPLSGVSDYGVGLGYGNVVAPSIPVGLGCDNVVSPSISSVSCSAPAPRVISNNCRCVKTIARPQQIRQVIEKPVVRQYVQKFNRPVVQKIVYRTKGASSGSLNEGLYNSGSLYNSGCDSGLLGGNYPIVGDNCYSGLDNCGSYPTSYGQEAYSGAVDSCSPYTSTC